MSDSRGKPSKPATQPPPERRRLTAVPERRRLPAAATPTAGPTALAVKLPAALAKVTQKRSNIHEFDKAFPVLVSSARGLANGVGRNISPEGMFIETREPCSIGSVVRITFEQPTLGTELTAVAEVRFQSFLNFAGEGGDQDGLRGMGVRFVRFEEDESRPARGSPQ